MRVRATQKGLYPSGHFRNVGDVFDVDPKMFSKTWMVEVEGAQAPSTPAADPAPENKQPDTEAPKPKGKKGKQADTEG